MHTEPIPEPTSADIVTPLRRPTTSPAKEKTMEPSDERFKHFWLRPTLFAAAMGMSATMMLSVCSAFYIVSSEPVLVDTPEARSSIAGCEALGDRVARQGCVRHLVASASAQDVGTSQIAAVAPHQRGTRQ